LEFFLSKEGLDGRKSQGKKSKGKKTREAREGEIESQAEEVA
jgi:hypothetical protein